MDQVLYRQALNSGNHLDPEAVEVAPFRGNLATERLAFYQPATADSDVVTNGYRKRVQHILTLQVQALEQIRQVVKQALQYVFQLMQPTVEGRLVEHEKALLLFHVLHCRAVVALKVACRYYRRGHYDCISYSIIGFFTQTYFFQEIVQKAVYCYYLFRHRIKWLCFVVGTSKITTCPMSVFLPPTYTLSLRAT